MKVEDLVFVPGEKVRYAGAECEVVRVDELPLPAGGTVTTVVIRRPRAGEKRVFPVELVRGFRLDEGDREAFR